VTTSAKYHRESVARAGEFFAGYILEERGIRTTHVDVSSDDLWVKTPSGRLLTLQVKASTSPQTDKRHTSPRYAFIQHSVLSTANVFVFVALDLKLLLVTDSMKKTRKFPARAFTPEAMEESIAEHLY